MSVRSIIASGALALALVACGGGPLVQQLRGTPVSPGSDAKVVAKIDSARMETELQVESQNLPLPDRIDAGSKFYVLWARKDSKQQWTRVGSFEYDAGGQTGKWHGSYPDVSFELVVSVEKEASPGAPSGKNVFQTTIVRTQ